MKIIKFYKIDLIRKIFGIVDDSKESHELLSIATTQLATPLYYARLEREHCSSDPNEESINYNNGRGTSTSFLSEYLIWTLAI